MNIIVQVQPILYLPLSTPREKSNVVQLLRPDSYLRRSGVTGMGAALTKDRSNFGHPWLQKWRSSEHAVCNPYLIYDVNASTRHRPTFKFTQPSGFRFQ